MIVPMISTRVLPLLFGIPWQFLPILYFGKGHAFFDPFDLVDQHFANGKKVSHVVGKSTEISCVANLAAQYPVPLNFDCS